MPSEWRERRAGDRPSRQTERQTGRQKANAPSSRVRKHPKAAPMTVRTPSTIGDWRWVVRHRQQAQLLSSTRAGRSNRTLEVQWASGRPLAGRFRSPRRVTDGSERRTAFDPGKRRLEARSRSRTAEAWGKPMAEWRSSTRRLVLPCLVSTACWVCAQHGGRHELLIRGHQAQQGRNPAGPDRRVSDRWTARHEAGWLLGSPGATGNGLSAASDGWSFPGTFHRPIERPRRRTIGFLSQRVHLASGRRETLQGGGGGDREKEGRLPPPSSTRRGGSPRPFALVHARQTTGKHVLATWQAGLTLATRRRRWARRTG